MKETTLSVIAKEPLGDCGNLGVFAVNAGYYRTTRAAVVPMHRDSLAVSVSRKILS